MMRCVYFGGKGPSCYVHEGLQGGVHPPCRLTNSCLHGLELLVAASPTSSGHTARHERPTTIYLPCLVLYGCCALQDVPPVHDMEADSEMEMDFYREPDKHGDNINSTAHSG